MILQISAPVPLSHPPFLILAAVVTQTREIMNYEANTPDTIHAVGHVHHFSVLDSVAGHGVRVDLAGDLRILYDEKGRATDRARGGSLPWALVGVPAATSAEHH